LELLKTVIVTEWQNYHNVLLTVAYTSGVVVLNNEYVEKMTVDMSNTALSLE